MDDPDAFINVCFTAAQKYGDAAGKLPEGDDYSYHMAFRGFRTLMDTNKELTLDLIDTVIAAHVPANRRVPVKTIPSSAARCKTVMDGIETLLENVDHLLDEAKGSKLRATDQQALSFGSAPTSTQHQLIKPQLSFAIPVDNSYSPFRPLVYDDAGNLQRGAPGVHPYQELISSFSFPPEQLQPRDEIAFLDVSTSPFSFIDTEEDLAALVALLRRDNVKEVAVDLEHHSYHSFQGFTCLMQLSTRTADYIIDCLRLRAQMWRLKSLFLDPAVVKVFHGAHEDIKWLQKDFGLYVANMFDTGIAMQTLRMPHSLFSAVDYFCQVKLDKKYQMADWRLRPLPREMVMYARLDTHYLLYCFDRLRILLLNSENQALGNLLLHVFQESRRLCLSRYEKPTLDEERSYVDSMGASLAGLDETQRGVVKEVFNWRDRAARDADESAPAVMHNSSILQLALRQPTQPSEVLRTINPVTLTVRKGVNELVDIIARCRGGAAEALTSGSGAAGAASGDAMEEDAQLRRKRRYQQSFVPQTGMLPSLLDDGLPMSVRKLEETSAPGKKQPASSPSVWFVAISAIAPHITSKAALGGLPRLAMPRQEFVPVNATSSADVPRNAGTVQQPSSQALPVPGTAGEAVADAQVELTAEDTAQNEDEGKAEPAGGRRMLSLAEEYGVGRQTRRRAAKEGKSKQK